MRGRAYPVRSFDWFSCEILLEQLSGRIVSRHVALGQRLDLIRFGLQAVENLALGDLIQYDTFQRP